jgi:hypothetical protein
VFPLVKMGASEREVDYCRKNCCGLYQYHPFKIVTLQHTGEVEDQNSYGDHVIDEEQHLYYLPTPDELPADKLVDNRGNNRALSVCLIKPYAANRLHSRYQQKHTTGMETSQCY